MFKNDFLGGIWPVVQRELREGARRPFNYWLRVGAASAGLLAVVYITAENRNETEKVMGQNLFAGLHVLLIGLICLVVPLMTADCIAREKREGTLGLLFLTPLTAGGIVAGKGLAQALRALTLWVSVAPVLAIPFVMGGIEWADASAFLALEFSVLMLCLAAGLLASTLVRGRGAAFVLALFLGALFAAVFCQLVCFLILGCIPPVQPEYFGAWFPLLLLFIVRSANGFLSFPGCQHSHPSCLQPILSRCAPDSVVKPNRGFASVRPGAPSRSVEVGKILAGQNPFPSSRELGPEILHACIQGLVRAPDGARSGPQPDCLAATVFLEGAPDQMGPLPGFRGHGQHAPGERLQPLQL